MVDWPTIKSDPSRVVHRPMQEEDTSESPDPKHGMWGDEAFVEEMMHEIPGTFWDNYRTAQDQAIKDQMKKQMENRQREEEIRETLYSASSHDPVEKPRHYNMGEIEVIDVIRDKLTASQFLGYCMGNVYKYTMRFQYKGGVEDLRKATWYLNKAIEASNV